MFTILSCTSRHSKSKNRTFLQDPKMTDIQDTVTVLNGLLEIERLGDKAGACAALERHILKIKW